MAHYLLGRAGQALLVVLAVSLIVFTLLRLSGDPAEILTPLEATPEQREEFRREFGLDRPFYIQYANFVSAAARGNFGSSLLYRRPAISLVAERLPATLELAVAAVILTVVIGVPAGVMAAVRRGSLIDRGVVSLSVIAQAVPSFWLGVMLILFFAVRLHWLPSSGRGTLYHLFLPTLTLAAFLVGQVLLLVRAGMIDVLREPYIRTAKAKGLPPRRVEVRHALRNVLLPVVTVAGLQLGSLFGGAVITETVFSWPGLGLLTVQAIGGRDYAVVQASVLVMALGILTVNLLVDLAYGWLDPRIRYG